MTPKLVPMRLVFARGKRQMSQGALAEAAKVGVNSICNWENGRCTPQIAHLMTLARILEVKPEYLLGTED